MSQPKTVDRGVSLIKFVLGLLRAHPDGKRPRDIYMEIESKLPLDDFDKETMKGSGLPRWRATLHFHSVAATKAVLLVKSDGRWRVTDEGQKLVTLPDYELKRLMRSRYREWQLEPSEGKDRWNCNRCRRNAATRHFGSVRRCQGKGPRGNRHLSRHPLGLRISEPRGGAP